MTFRPEVEENHGQGARSASESSRDSRREAPSVPQGEETKVKVKVKGVPKLVNPTAPSITVGRPKHKEVQAPGRRVVLKEKSPS